MIPAPCCHAVLIESRNFKGTLCRMYPILPSGESCDLEGSRPFSTVSATNIVNCQKERTLLNETARWIFIADVVTIVSCRGSTPKDIFDVGGKRVIRESNDNNKKEKRNKKYNRGSK